MNNKQVRLSLLSHAGGAGKTTLAVNIGYELAQRGYSTLIIDLDCNCSLIEFCGVSPTPENIELVFNPKFNGNYPTQAIFGTDKLQIIPGSTQMSEVMNSLVGKKRREYYLQKLISTFPLVHDFVIFDCRAGLDLLSDNAIAASTHLLIPLNMGVKIMTGGQLITSILETIADLELNPAPEIMGIVPNKTGKAAYHRQFLQELPEICDALQVKLYQDIPLWQHLENSGVEARPLKQARPGDKICQNFSLLADDLEQARNGQ